MDSLAQAVDVQLAWDASPSPQVTGYQLYYGTGSKQYSVSLDTGTATTAALSGLQAGQKYYFAVLAYDADGDPSPLSNEVSYTVPAGDTAPPTVSITEPVNGASVARKSTVTIAVTASDNVGVTRVEVLVGGQLTCTDVTAAYSCAWTVPPTGGNKTYRLQAKAFDAHGNVGASSIVTVSVR